MRQSLLRWRIGRERSDFDLVALGVMEDDAGA